MYEQPLSKKKLIYAVAPCMDWTDRHCRYFHRLLSKNALLYTEMVVADALIHGDIERHLAFSDCEHPVALQLGGSDPEKLAKAAKIGADWGYDEINLNVGCPSDRVQSGTFGACLMEQPELVASCIDAMKQVVDIPVTVKCRIGVDDQDPQQALPALAEAVFAKECDAIWVHARKAWLQGLSPKQNRDVPPLDYKRVHALKAEFPDKFIGINGGLKTPGEAVEKVRNDAQPLNGIMLGRASYQNPSIMLEVDREVYGDDKPPRTLENICAEMMDYTASHLKAGGRVNHITRHMIGLFQGQVGARRYRQIMSVDASKPDADERVIEQAFAAITLPINAVA